MRMKVSDYIAEFLVKNNITHVFTVTGGGAMHLNDSLGHNEGLKCIYNHHEQACAIAAESYARVNNKIAAVCVTTGPGGTNAITGVVGGYLDSIPMLIISGQVRYDTTARSTGLNLRAMGDQEFDICKAVESMTKYCEMVVDPMKIRYCLEKALFLAVSGRPGPCWLDIPLNVQGAYIETDELERYKVTSMADDTRDLPEPVTEKVIKDVIDKIKQSKRPVIYAGNGIRISGAHNIFMRIVNKLNIPIVTAWNSIDAIYTKHPLYVGRGGIMGDRAGNFAVQNSDLVISIGCRLSIRQVGYNWKTWAREAYTIMVDVDKAELKKPTLHVDMPIWAHAYDFLFKLESYIDVNCFNENKGYDVFKNEYWLATCSDWKKNYPVVLPKHKENIDGLANVYYFIDKLSKSLLENQYTVVGNGSACVVGSHGYYIKPGQRFIINSAIASMGYDLPAAIGAYFARSEMYYAENDDADIICITGDGSIQMNLQELQTIIHHKLPIKIFVINNGGYHSIRQTQTNLFNSNFVGIGEESGDLSFPSMEKLAWAYGYPYYKMTKNEDIALWLDKVLEDKGPVICEVFVSPKQNFEPKSATKKLPDGKLVSPPLEDLAPFLPREEFETNMIIDMIGEE